MFNFKLNSLRVLTYVCELNYLFPKLFSKVLRPEKLVAHVFEVDEDVEKDEVR